MARSTILNLMNIYFNSVSTDLVIKQSMVIFLMYSYLSQIMK